MKYLLILNDPPYGTERRCEGTRLAIALVKDEKNVVRLRRISTEKGAS